ncbi:MAG: hypothetical protein ABH848_00945 [Candidatus Omnitrophota bacterium]
MPRLKTKIKYFIILFVFLFITIDISCHLSEKGSKIQAEFILKEMKKNNLL